MDKRWHNIIYIHRKHISTSAQSRVVRRSNFQDPIQQLSDPIQSTPTVYILTHIQFNPFPSDRWQTATFKTENEKYLIKKHASYSYTLILAWSMHKWKESNDVLKMGFRPNPIQSNPWIGPIHGQLWYRVAPKVSPPPCRIGILNK